MNNQETHEIKPYLGIGQILIGQSREDVRVRINSPHVEFRRTEGSLNTSDHFEARGMLVYYDANDLVEAIEVTLPADIRFQGHPLLKMKSKDVIYIMTKIDPSLLLEEDSFISFSLGISAYMPEGSLSADAFPESILVFRKGYYD